MPTPLHRSLGLSDEEASAIRDLLGRDPNHLELAMYAVMWSEHCSYKSSRAHLSRLPTEGARVLVGPGENAGVIDAGGGLAIAIRIESHNHPSAIEPYQGAATGVGGILRDIFTMGARPVALLDSLRFGPLEDPRARWVATGVVSGISGYGNSVGVPTIGGEVAFDKCFSGNPLVNVMSVGILRKDRLVLGRASGVGNLAVLLGSSTGRDGIGGVSVLASAVFGDDAAVEEAKRPNVQVGDPYEEKRLIEACLELLDNQLVVGVQDLGGAGLTCATSETASRGGVGMDVDVTAVPRREEGMAPWEVMTSESQERMLAIVEPGNLERVMQVCSHWEVRASVVGKVTAGGRLRILQGWEGEVLADVPAVTLHEDAPLCRRLLARPSGLEERWADDPDLLAPPSDCGADLMALLADLSWIYRQYDHQLFLNTVVGPGADAAVLALNAPGVTDRLEGQDVGSLPRAAGMALSTDGNSRWCSADPRVGTALVVAESALNVACVGASPTAVVNCLNFGNPEKPEVMWQLSESVDGMAEACRELGIPVVGGNVSLYNESAGSAIDPTPVVGTLGLLDRLDSVPPLPVLIEGDVLVLIGAAERGTLGASAWARVVRSHKGGRPLAPDWGLHRRLLALLGRVVSAGLVEGIHDVSDGGVGVALAEMALRSGVGFGVQGFSDHRELFAECASRVVACVADSQLDRLQALASQEDVPCRVIGTAGGDRIVFRGLVDLPLDGVARSYRSLIPDALALG